MITAVHLQTLTIFLLLHSISASSSCIQTCSSHVVPYPFGFSSSCTIPLNCSTSNGSISLNHFPIRTLSSESILVSLHAECNRSIHTFRSLFSSNYAPTSNNGILLKNCPHPPTPCKLPSTAVKTNFELYDCGGVSSDVSCYSENRTEAMFLSYEEILKTECEFLFSSISVEAVNVTEISLDVQVVQIGWWIEGECRCVVDADCVEVLSPVTRQGAFRCKCKKGFIGDGFVDGLGCRKGELHGCVTSLNLDSIRQSRTVEFCFGQFV